jgi:8-oxo-dGTP pyrophosphatase MutT (NUDIX family)
MSKAHRIAAGGLIFRDDAVLLVRYRDANGGTYLVGPGGKLEEEENVVQAIVRETMEETNIRVQPKRVVIIEDLICTRFKMIKVWMICEVVEGNICKTDGAKEEGIIKAAWFTKSQLAGEIVFPLALVQHDWDQLWSENWQVECLPTRKAIFERKHRPTGRMQATA